MNATPDEVDSADGMQGFIGLLAQARDSADVVEAVRLYLDAWPAERIARIQRIDAGWAPFDAQLNPSPPLGPADLRKICDAVHEQCAALASAGVAVDPDLLKLDEALWLACRMLEALSAEPIPARPAASGASRHA